MRMNWFRVYNDARNDAKLRTLSDSQFRVWFNLLCMASDQEQERGQILGIPSDLLSIEVAGGDDELLAATLRQLERLRIISVKRDVTPCNAAVSEVRVTCCDIVFLHFLERQYDKPSDYPEARRERVQKYRSTHENEDVTRSNAMKRDVTHREEKIREDKNIQEESMCDIPQAEMSPAHFADAVWQAYPSRNGKKLNKAKAYEALKKIKAKDWPALMVAVNNYAESGQGPMDAFRFLQNDYWREWLEPAATKFGRRPSKAAESAAFLAEVIDNSERFLNGRRDKRTAGDSGEISGYLDIGKWPAG